MLILIMNATLSINLFCLNTFLPFLCHEMDRASSEHVNMYMYMCMWYIHVLRIM